MTSIESHAFAYCYNLTHITIPNSIKFIGSCAFIGCDCFKRSNPGKIVYKGFRSNMKCRDFQYKEGKTYQFEGKPILCERGFHACTNVLDVFNYYYGKPDIDFVVHKVSIGKIFGQTNRDSKIVTDKITIGKKLSIEDINKIINS